MQIEIPFTGPAYISESLMISPEECTNFYLRPYPEMGKEKMALVGTPGMELWVTVNSGYEIRGTLAFGNYLYVAAGRKLYRVDFWGASTEIGSLNTETGKVGIATNGLDVVVVDGLWGYVYDLATDVFARITDEDFPGGNTIAHMDGYYLVNKPNTGQVWRSDYNDGSSWHGLAFSTAGSDPDNIVSIIIDHRDVWTIGESTTEIWYNAGLPTFNFARIEGAYIEQGGVSNHATAKANNAVYWLGRDKLGQGQVFQALGRQPRVISTAPVSYSLSQYGLSDAFMFSYQQVGHTHIVLTLPADKLTWVYDSSIGEWHKRSSIIDGYDDRWRAETHALFNGDHIVGDAEGKLYKLKTDVYAENGTQMVATRTSPILRSKQNRITVDEVTIVHEPGVGLITGADEDIDPQALLSWSRDGGRTWSAEVDMPLGKIGEYDNMAKATQLGQGTNWVFKYKISAAVKRIVLGAIAEAEEDDDG